MLSCHYWNSRLTGIEGRVYMTVDDLTLVCLTEHRCPREHLIGSNDEFRVGHGIYIVTRISLITGVGFWLPISLDIRLAHLVWTKTTPEWILKYFDNGITLVDGVKTIWSLNIFLTLFMHVPIVIIKKPQFFKAKQWLRQVFTSSMSLNIFQLGSVVENDINAHRL